MQHTVIIIPFGGFESCETGNPFVLRSVGSMNSPENYPHGCPLAYTKYPITLDDGCWISVCLFLNSTSGIQALLPPFYRYPNSLYTNEVLATFTGVNGEKWMKDPSGQWVISGGMAAMEPLPVKCHHLRLTPHPIPLTL